MRLAFRACKSFEGLCNPFYRVEALVFDEPLQRILRLSPTRTFPRTWIIPPFNTMSK